MDTSNSNSLANFLDAVKLLFFNRNSSSVINQLCFYLKKLPIVSFIFGQKCERLISLLFNAIIVRRIFFIGLIRYGQLIVYHIICLLVLRVNLANPSHKENYYFWVQIDRLEITDHFDSSPTFRVYMHT